MAVLRSRLFTLLPATGAAGALPINFHCSGRTQDRGLTVTQTAEQEANKNKRGKKTSKCKKNSKLLQACCIVSLSMAEPSSLQAGFGISNFGKIRKTNKLIELDHLKTGLSKWQNVLSSQKRSRRCSSGELFCRHFRGAIQPFTVL